jgi:glycosidase
MEVVPTFEFHVSRVARERYQFDDIFFSIAGSTVFVNIAAARQFAHRMNEVRQAHLHPERTVFPGSLAVMGLIDELQHALLARYREQRDPRAIIDALHWFEDRLGHDSLQNTLLAFATIFPVTAVYRGQNAALWLTQSTGGMPNRAIAFEEMMFLSLANSNPAYRPYRELFDDLSLTKTTSYKDIVASLRQYFDTRPRFGPNNENLIDILKSPALAAPDSLSAQLAYIRENWLPMLGDWLAQILRRILTALDILKEEELAIWMRFHPAEGLDAKQGDAGAWLGGDSGAGAILRFGAYAEYEAFSKDIDWMPRTVMMAKSVYVWLDQLSRGFGRSITHLDHVPDEELDTLARRGFNALWLIGVWERSRASQHIKHLCGNPEAGASAYSLADYNIAEDLGGESAYANLRDRAGLRGIRLASDMVPNHMGIDSRWVIQHPDWFLSLPQSPYPAYSFDGPDLSHDGRVEIKLEDHYYNRSDAAVVFRRQDRHTGDTRYIYHGNDGTGFAWNDTAQLNYLRSDVREAVIQTILHVARMFPIIRFDAAMTLAKQHYQRLWFPEPGTGGAIPSRAEHGMMRKEFDAAIPVEFWREVVDRIGAEVPGTLLLAEAYWLMEGYFVRTLGMHRVYNSAFMNMLRDEQNANYRSLMKNTLEFDPDVLRRYVNFMSNPDERTAIDQFGNGDKYFGVCTLMATMPGLPMFGHGQIEGLTERYGMEYQRARHDERADPWLVARHEREIAPLLRRRALFAGVENFLLYDFYGDDGRVNEDVFAYSNRLGNERALVIYHNRYSHTVGWVRVSCQYTVKRADGGRWMRPGTLGESFSIASDESAFVAWRDVFTGLEYLHPARDLTQEGLRVELDAYKCHVFVDWRDLKDDVGHPWTALHNILGGRGVTCLDDVLDKLRLTPVQNAAAYVLDPVLARQLADCASMPVNDTQDRQRRVSELTAEASRRIRTFLEDAACYSRQVSSASGEPNSQLPWSGNIDESLRRFERRIAEAMKLPRVYSLFGSPLPPEARTVLPDPVCTTTASSVTSSMDFTPEDAENLGTNQAQTTEHISGPRVHDASGPAAEAMKVSLSQIAIWGTVLAWSEMEALGYVCNPRDTERSAAECFDALRLRGTCAEAFSRLGLLGEDSWRSAARVRVALAHSVWAPQPERTPIPFATPINWLHDPDVAWLIGTNEYQGVRYFVKESFEELLWWMSLRQLLEIAGSTTVDVKAVRALKANLDIRMVAARETGYRVESMLEYGR